MRKSISFFREILYNGIDNKFYLSVEKLRRVFFD